jgi:hypothetical protein
MFHDNVEPLPGVDLQFLQHVQVLSRLHRHTVPPLFPDAALQLFRKQAGQRPESVSEAVEAQVVRSCGGLPLALLITGGAVAGQECEVAWMVSHSAPSDMDCDCDARLLQLVTGPLTMHVVDMSCIVFALWHACCTSRASSIDNRLCAKPDGCT